MLLKDSVATDVAIQKLESSITQMRCMTKSYRNLGQHHIADVCSALLIEYVKTLLYFYSLSDHDFPFEES